MKTVLFIICLPGICLGCKRGEIDVQTVDEYIRENPVQSLSQDISIWKEEPDGLQTDSPLLEFLEEVTFGEYEKAKPLEEKIKSDTLELKNIKLVTGDEYIGLGYNKSIDKYLLAWFSREGESFIYYMIDKSGGEVYISGQHPLPSPNGKILLTYRNDGDPEIFTTVTFYDVKKNEFKEYYALGGKGLQINELYWKNEQTVYLELFDMDQRKYWYKLSPVFPS